MLPQPGRRFGGFSDFNGLIAARPRLSTSAPYAATPELARGKGREATWADLRRVGVKAMYTARVSEEMCCRLEAWDGGRQQRVGMWRQRRTHKHWQVRQAQSKHEQHSSHADVLTTRSFPLPFQERLVESSDLLTMLPAATARPLSRFHTVGTQTTTLTPCNRIASGAGNWTYVLGWAGGR